MIHLLVALCALGFAALTVSFALAVLIGKAIALADRRDVTRP